MSALAVLEPVQLDELVATAELLARVDRKYVVPRAAVDDLLRVASRGERVRALEIDGARTQPYASVYFDTPDLLSFRMAAHGRRRRFKLRTRVYELQRVGFLEVKTRGARGTTVKDRIPHDPDRRDALDADALAYVDAAIASLGIDPEPLSLVPQLVTGYRRSTLLVGAARATIDVDLTWALPDGTTLRVPDIAIVETKSAARTSSVDRALWRRGHRPGRISKYATGLAAMRPELPSNAWHRVLTRSFGRV